MARLGIAAGTLANASTSSSSVEFDSSTTAAFGLGLSVEHGYLDRHGRRRCAGAIAERALGDPEYLSDDQHSAASDEQRAAVQSSGTVPAYLADATGELFAGLEPAVGKLVDHLQHLVKAPA